MNGLRLNLVHSFLFGPRCLLRNVFDYFGRVRDPDLLKTYSCKGLDKFHLNHNDLNQLILIVSFFNY